MKYLQRNSMGNLNLFFHKDKKLPLLQSQYHVWLRPGDSKNPVHQHTWYLNRIDEYHNQKALKRFFWNLKHTLVLRVPGIDIIFKIINVRSRSQHQKKWWFCYAWLWIWGMSIAMNVSTFHNVYMVVSRCHVPGAPHPSLQHAPYAYSPVNKKTCFYLGSRWVSSVGNKIFGTLAQKQMSLICFIQNSSCPGQFSTHPGQNALILASGWAQVSLTGLICRDIPPVNIEWSVWWIYYTGLLMCHLIITIVFMDFRDTVDKVDTEE